MKLTPPFWASGKQAAAIGFTFALAMFLRLFYLGFNSLWLDESNSVRVAEAPIWQVVTATQPYYHPPLYTVLLHFWLSLGSNEFLLRFPSVLLGVLSVAVLYRFAKPLFGTSVALLSAFLLAISALHVWYSQEVRGYILVTFLGLASVYFFSRILFKSRGIYWLAYILTTLAGLYTSYGMLLLVVAQNLYFLIAFRHFTNKRLVLWWLMGQGLLLLGFWPWLPRLLGQVEGAIAGYSVVIRVRQFSYSFGLDVGGLTFTISLLTLIVLVLALMAVMVQRLWERRLLVFSLSFGAYSVVTLLSALPQGGSIKRQLLILFPYFLLAVSLGVHRLRLAGATFMVVAFLVTVPALAANYFVNQKEQWREVARLIEERGREGDIILLHADYTTVPFEYYYGAALPRQGVFPTDTFIRLRQTVSVYERVWLILNHDIYVDPEGKVRRWFDRCYNTELSSNFAYITVRLYEVAKKECSLSTTLEGNKIWRGPGF